MRYLLLLVMTAAFLGACGGEGSSGESLSTKPRPSNPFALADAPAAPQKKQAELAAPTDANTTVASVDTQMAAVVQTEAEESKTQRRKRLAPARAQFAAQSHNYGNITEGAIVEHTFVLENTGERPLEILKTSGSCGCTVASYSFLPIKPGGKSEIKARFNSLGKLGKQKTTLTVTTNAQPRTYILSLEGTVRPEKQGSASNDTTN